MNLQLLVYCIASNQKECLMLEKYVSKIYLPKTSRLLIIDNTGSNILKHDGKVVTRRKESLNRIIVNYVLSSRYSHYCRIDPDDIDENLDLLENIEYQNHDYLIPHYKIIRENYSYVLNKENGMGTRYELLGAGIIVSRKVLASCAEELLQHRGQDNYISWLESYRNEYRINFSRNEYIYKISDTDLSMSSQRKRIIGERDSILRNKLKALSGSFLVYGRARTYRQFFSLTVKIQSKKLIVGFLALERIIFLIVDIYKPRKSSIRNIGINLPRKILKISSQALINAVVLGIITKKQSVNLVPFDRSFWSYSDWKEKQDDEHAIIGGLL